MKDKQRSISTRPPTNVAPLRLDPAFLRESPRRVSKTVKPQGGSISSNSLLKQAIANRLKPQTPADEGQLQQRYVPVNDVNGGLKTADNLSGTCEANSLKEASTGSMARNEGIGSTSSNTPDHLNENDKLAKTFSSLPLSADGMKKKIAESNDERFNSCPEVSGVHRTDDDDLVDSPLREEHMRLDTGDEFWENQFLQNPRNQPMTSEMREWSLKRKDQDSLENSIADDVGETRHSHSVNAKHSEFLGDTSPAKKKYSVTSDSNHLMSGSSNHVLTLSSANSLPSTDPHSYLNGPNKFTGHPFMLPSKQNKVPGTQNEDKGNVSPSESPHVTMTAHKCVTFSDQVQLHEIEPNDLPISENEEFESESEEYEETHPHRDATAVHQHISSETPETGRNYCLQQSVSNQFKEEECQTVESLLNSRFSTRAFFDNYSQTPHGGIGSCENLGSNSSLLSERSSQESPFKGLVDRFSDNETTAPVQMMSRSIPQYLSYNDAESGSDFLRGHHRDRREQNHCQHVLMRSEIPQDSQNLAKLEVNFIDQMRGNTEHTAQEEEKIRRQFLTSLRKEHRASAPEEDPCDPIHTVGSLDSILSSGSRESVISSVSIRKEAATHRNFMY
ncbi:hypothetical protein ANCDUO_23238 [Ancylostoma duodenale]|uniref:Uncharacterized protein n=1 Tax=Ancylostoma duodenale TaxID=51022 RepID=A0A0C2CA44_9BILA|nr:hypothetical protein ANCDUO_23238 [Ancylostoma duodenale]